MKRTSLVMLFIFALLTLSGCGVSKSDYEAKDPQSIEKMVVEIPSGSTPKSIAKKLEEEGIIKNADAFVAKVKELNVASKLKAGEYQLSQSYTVEEIVLLMAEGKVFDDRIKITIPEGYEVRQIIDKLAAEGLIEREAFEQELLTGSFDYAFLKGIDRSAKLEGFLFPATYQFSKDQGEHAIIDAMLKAFDQNFDKSWYGQADQLNMSLNEVITLASIIEREAQAGNERPIVSSVFHNRLKIPMRLQSCATVQYILGERKEVLSIKDTKIESPYNTYQHDGLPPSPIASPGKAAIEAALFPAQTDYLFFVTTNNGDGTHYFSKTLEEHNAAIKKSKK